MRLPTVSFRDLFTPRHAALALTASMVSIAATVAYGQADPDTRLRTALATRLPKTAIKAVDCRKIAGFCEVQAGSNLFYTDASGRYLVIGRVYDMETRADLTAARLLEISPETLVGGAASAERMNADAQAEATPKGARPASLTRTTAAKVSLAELPKGGAIEWGGSGPTVTVFSDFRCGYCRMLHGHLETMNVRVLERPISVLGTRLISDAVLCAADRKRALKAAYAGEELGAARKCDTSGLDANEKFARAHGFDGTPVLVRADGAVLEGYRPKEFLTQWIQGAQ